MPKRAIARPDGGVAGSRRFGALFAALVILGAGGCGYHLRGTGSSLPPDIKTIGIPVFRNMTTRYDLDVKLTRAVVDEFVARGKVRIVGDRAEADAVLEGVITSFSATPIGFSGGGQADRYNITVTASIILKGRDGEKAVFSNPSFVYNQEYSVPVGGEFETFQTEAIDKIAGQFARSLVVSILEGF